MSARTSGGTPGGAWAAFVRAAPTGLALVPVGMLFGVLAAQANWGALDVLLFGVLGFSGSGQFALLPLAAQGQGFLTMLLVAVSINSRYVPIAFVTASRLPRAPLRRAFLAHLLGDEAYAVEHEQDASVSILAIRLTIYGAWVLSTLAGVLAAGLLPRSSLSGGMNLGFPASAVLLVLSFGQLKVRVPRIAAPWRRRLAEMGLCIAAAMLLFAWLGPVWFWLPSIAFSSWRLWRAGA
ncbi:AzlC family ABC transporter permease [Verminephrobacter aporrectodeae]|uniref:AzlC family ABC transporter permease n=1 Tax=Verminephrobacter aporrectodeae TaxID=1110389 RepID=UPI002238814F|nr:AzlC family ABC transporter permease [Verminephrobacter aporrectodeae]